MLACGLPVEAGANGARVPSWMQTETTPAVATLNGPGCDAENVERDGRDPKLNSLLWQPHIGILLVIDALYSVCNNPCLYRL